MDTIHAEDFIVIKLAVMAITATFEMFFRAKPRGATSGSQKSFNRTSIFHVRQKQSSPHDHSLRFAFSLKFGVMLGMYHGNC